MDNGGQEVKKTVLYSKHLAGGAKMVDFAGYMMPIQYPDGIVAEHLWVRRNSGIFDVSHMGRFVFCGSGAAGFLQYVLSNDVSKLKVGASQYTIIPNEKGGAVDDAYLYRFAEGEYTLVVNAANKEKDWDHLVGHLDKFKGVEIEDATDRLAMAAVQGPLSEDILKELTEQGELPDLRRNCLSTVRICGTPVLVGRTGYTGEPVCFELFIPSESAGKFWDVLLEKGVKPVGLGARDTLRMEAGLPLYGHELGKDSEDQEIPVFACPLARFAVSLSKEKGDFIGRKMLERQSTARERYAGGNYSDRKYLPRLIRQLLITGRGICRAGAKVSCDGASVGYITSGTMVPYWKVENRDDRPRLTDETDKRAVALGLLDCEVTPGRSVEVDVRGKDIGAVVVKKNLENRIGLYAVAVVAD
jgi:aminomethyltransferase